MNKFQKKEEERRKRRLKQLIKQRITLSLLLILLISIPIIIYENKDKQNDNQLKAIEKQEDENILIVDTAEANSPEIDSKITDWELILVNKDNKLPKNYEVELKDVEYVPHKVDKRIVESLKKMLSDARKQGLNPLVISSYRSHEFQQTLYNNKIKEFRELGYSKKVAEEKASYWVAIPGTSEHEIGLALDIVATNYQELDEEQENTPVQKWLMENCYKYGFILRYPTEKKEITKINYEPWHYRYVGVENATFMEEKGFCLEEYIDYLKNYNKV